MNVITIFGAILVLGGLAMTGLGGVIIYSGWMMR